MYTLIEIALSVGVLVSLITALSACVCGCKNSNQKSELVGTAGVVKIRFDEEAPSPAPTTPAASTQNSQRSLPEIPQPVGRHDSGDTASEIYATVNLDTGNKAAAEPSTSRDHPYEHAYAKLQNDNHNIAVEITPDSREDEIAIDERDASQSGPDSVVISARVAISGALPSSHELPYITPPSPRHNQHFSGDSTDSAKGYTSISVREPLSNIRAQSAAAAPAAPHYATVSDDSDEMYAAIEEGLAGSGSATYAQIPERRRREPAQPDDHHARRSAPPEIGASTSNATHSRQASSSSCSNSTGALGSPKPEKRQANSPLPPPPPAPAPAPAARAAHQRISSTGDLFNNDKLRRSLNEKHQRNNSCVSSSDFYGCNYPVDKHRFSSGDIIRPLVAKEIDIERAEPERASPQRNLDDMYAKVVKKAKSRPTDADEPAKFRADDPGYETIDRNKAHHGYETIAHKDRKLSRNQDPGYETVKDVGKNTNFANNNMLGKLNHVSDSGPDSLVSSDAGYEHISKMDNGASDSEPNYEVLRNQPPTPPYATIAPTYSTVNKRPGKYSDWPNNNGDLVESTYESMPHDPLYKGSGSESDPNYESVRPKDPNYDDVRTRDPNYESLRLKDPKYESVRSKASKSDSMRSKKDPNYESVKYFELSKKEPPYEELNNEAAGGSVQRSDSGAGYERIAARPQPPAVNGAGADQVGDYFQV
ncbi:uncharacterized protein LOC125240253 isoform X2 [Leguminivora glycinivorella]|uniref:uncharacterized protein LOC125240253 isoform X2 n=1 Tax=Leguminivora glycinivorella TaxID=1035111 RepID=UPI00200FD2D8|nr:uncharacterized protein LOC125240253 isoform X2 [Leguminivora glycinivorella]